MCVLLLYDVLVVVCSLVDCCADGALVYFCCAAPQACKECGCDTAPHVRVPVCFLCCIAGIQGVWPALVQSAVSVQGIDGHVQALLGGGTSTTGGTSSTVVSLQGCEHTLCF